MTQLKQDALETMIQFGLDGQARKKLNDIIDRESEKENKREIAISRRSPCKLITQNKENQRNVGLNTAQSVNVKRVEENTETEMFYISTKS